MSLVFIFKLSTTKSLTVAIPALRLAIRELEKLETSFFS